MRPRRPTPEELLCAAEWCECFEGEPSLKAVATWLDRAALDSIRADFVRSAMKETGCSRAHAVRVWRSNVAASALSRLDKVKGKRPLRKITL